MDPDRLSRPERHAQDERGRIGPARRQRPSVGGRFTDVELRALASLQRPVRPEAEDEALRRPVRREADGQISLDLLQVTGDAHIQLVARAVGPRGWRRRNGRAREHE